MSSRSFSALVRQRGVPPVLSLASGGREGGDSQLVHRSSMLSCGQGRLRLYFCSFIFFVLSLGPYNLSLPETYPISQHTNTSISSSSKAPRCATGCPNNTKAASEPFGKDRWLRIGDICSIDAYNEAGISDRVEEIIGVSGVAVAPRRTWGPPPRPSGSQGA